MTDLFFFHFREEITYQEARVLWYNPVQQPGRDAALEAEDDNNEGRKEEKRMFLETPHLRSFK